MVDWCFFFKIEGLIYWSINLVYSSTDLSGESGKELDNIILLLSYIFNFRMISSKFLFEILNKLADSFKTKVLVLFYLLKCL